MARIRTIKPGFFRHEDLQELEANNPGSYCMLVFIGLWTQCDNQGVFPCQPRQLKLDILPFLDFEMEKTLSLLEDATFIKRYTAGGKPYGIIHSLPEHQRFSGKEAGEKGKVYPSPEQRDNAPEQQQGINGEAPGKQSGRNGEALGKHQGSDSEVPGKQRGNNGEAPGNSKAEINNSGTQNACQQRVSGEGKHSGSSGEATGKHPGSNGEASGKQLGSNGENPVSQEREREKERSKDTSVSFCPEQSDDNSGLPDSILEIPLIKKDGFFSVTQEDINEWQDTFPGVDVLAELKKYRQWAKDKPNRRKTAGGIRKSISYWLSKVQDQGRGAPSGNGSPSRRSQDSPESKLAWLREQSNENLKALAGRGNIPAFDILRERGVAMPP